MQKKDILLKDIELTADNTRSKAHKKNGSLDGLKTSIETFGVIVPIIVRPHPKHKDKYELRAGERRYLASKAAKFTTIPALIQDMDDKTANEVTFLENQHRLNLDLDESIRGIQQLIKTYGEDTKAIADKLGMTERQVKLRMNALNLSKRWKVIVSEHKIPGLTAEHLDIIARLPKEIQDDTISDIEKHFHWQGKYPVAELEKDLNTQYTHALAKAKWDLDAKIGGLIPCSECQKRSDKLGQDEFWPTDKNKKVVSLCLNGGCWNQKLAITIADGYKSVLEKNAVICVVKHPLSGHARLIASLVVEKTGLSSAKVNDRSEYKSAKKSDKGAVCLFDISTGSTSWAVPKYQQVVTGTGTASSGTPSKVKTMKERKQTHHGLRLKLMMERICEAIRTTNEPVDKSLKFAAALAAVLPVDSRKGVISTGNEKVDEFKAVEDFVAGKHLPFGLAWDKESQWEVDIAGALWLKARECLVRSMKFDGPADRALNKEVEARRIAAIIGFDWDKAWKEVIEEKPDPKIWKTLNADGTKK